MATSTLTEFLNYDLSARTSSFLYFFVLSPVVFRPSAFAVRCVSVSEEEEEKEKDPGD